MTKIGATILVWREARYLDHVLRTAIDAGVEVVVAWARRPHAWTLPGTPPDGWASGVHAVLADLQNRPNLHVLRWSGMPPQDCPAHGDRRTRAVIHQIELALGCAASVVLDSDYVYEPEAFAAAVKVVEESPDRYYSAGHIAFWRTPEWRVGDSDETILFAHPLKPVEGGFVEDAPELRTRLPLTCYHPSYARPEVEMREKLASFGHADIVPEGWVSDVWMQPPREGQRAGFQVPTSWIVWRNPDPIPLSLRGVLT